MSSPNTSPSATNARSSAAAAGVPARRLDVAALAPPRWITLVRRAFAGVACANVVMVVAQLFVAGLGVFLDPRYYAVHRTLARGFVWIDVLILALAFVGRLPQTVKRLAATLVMLLVVQHVTIQFRGVRHLLLAAVHPVSAAFLFAAALAMARSGVRATRTADAAH